MKTNVLVIAFLGLFCTATANAGKTATNYMERARNVAHELMQQTKKTDTWDCHTALRNNALMALFEASGDSALYLTVKTSVDHFVAEQEKDASYAQNEQNLRNLCGGIGIHAIYRHNLGENKYLNALALLRKQLYSQPRTTKRAFLFDPKQSDEVRLEGLYMAMPFYCLYATLFDEAKVFGDIALQFSLADEYTQDTHSGLNRPAWSERNPSLPVSIQGIAFHMTAIVDVLDYFPIDHPYRKDLIATFKRLSTALQKCKQTKSGLWPQMPQLAAGANNPADPTATALCIYAIAKGVKQGYLPEKHLKTARKAFNGLLYNNLTDNDTASAFILAAVELELC